MFVSWPQRQINTLSLLYVCVCVCEQHTLLLVQYVLTHKGLSPTDIAGPLPPQFPFLLSVSEFIITITLLVRVNTVEPPQ